MLEVLSLQSLLADPAVLRAVAPDARSCRFAPHETLFALGAPADGLHVIRSGLVKIVHERPDGRRMIVDVMGRGDVAGGMSVFGGGPRATSAVAIGTVDTELVSAETVLALARANPELSLAITAYAARYVDAVFGRLIEQASLDVLTRLARRILDIVDLSDEELPVGVELTRAELADLAGASKEAVGLAIGQMKRLGWLTVSRGLVTVVNDAGMRAHVSRAFAGRE